MTKEKILQSLKQIIDPELGTNIVDLGLIYKMDVDNKKKTVKVVMTLTTPFCPFNNYLIEQVKDTLNNFKFDKADLQLIFDPPWDPKMMNSELKKKIKINQSKIHESFKKPKRKKR